jgi:hypothetical protein
VVIEILRRQEATDDAETTLRARAGLRIEADPGAEDEKRMFARHVRSIMNSSVGVTKGQGCGFTTFGKCYSPGRFDDAVQSYDAALVANPGASWALFGRGLAKLKAGDASGNADLSTAKAADTNVAAAFAAIGLSPG